VKFYKNTFTTKFINKLIKTQLSTNFTDIFYYNRFETNFSKIIFRQKYLSIIKKSNLPINQLLMNIFIDNENSNLLPYFTNKFITNNYFVNN